jgi:CRP/FNR family cyclic AMP-dependent transcriptional regulator
MRFRRLGDAEAGWELVRALKSADRIASAMGLSLLADWGEELAGEGAPLRPQQRTPKPGNRSGDMCLVPTWHRSLGLDPQKTMTKTGCAWHSLGNCITCQQSQDHECFCNFSPPVLQDFSAIGHQSILPDGTMLLLEGQMLRGVYVLCAGKVKLSTTSRDGKVLILKIAGRGEVLGLSAVVSGTPCGLTAQTTVQSRVNFIEREAPLRFFKRHGEAGFHSAQALSREFQSAYEDIQDLVLVRTSAGKLARLLLSWMPAGADGREVRVCSGLTHEEMAQMIGSSRETVTRLLSDLRRKQLIRLEGSSLVIRNRTALEALAS